MFGLALVIIRHLKFLAETAVLPLVAAIFDV
jgi:hypothetical protein